MSHSSSSSTALQASGLTPQKWACDPYSVHASAYLGRIRLDAGRALGAAHLMTGPGAPPVKRFFRRSTFFDSALTLTARASASLHSWQRQPLLLGRAERSTPPLARKGSRLQARGLMAKARRDNSVCHASLQRWFFRFRYFQGGALERYVDEFQKLLPIAGLQRVAANLVRQGCVDCGNPTFLAQFDCKRRAAGSLSGLPSEYLLCAGGK